MVSRCLRGDRDMLQLVPSAVPHSQVPTDQIRQTRAGLEAIVTGHGAAWSKFRPSEEIADLLKRERRTAGRDSSGGR